MENINIGVVNLVVSDSLKESYFNNKHINESKTLISDFINEVKNSPILQLEFKVFDNIENKHIENELMATRYIDNNIKLFEIYTLKEILNERKKLNKFVNENQVPDNDKTKLYYAIDVLIRESINDHNEINVDEMHEAFNYVLDYMRKPKQINEVSENEFENINEEVLEIAINKFNEKYNVLSEDDRNLLNILVASDTTKKIELLETYKTETLALLNGIKNNKTEDGVTKAINKIKEMMYSKNSNVSKQRINEDIIKLHELKKELL
ncbi:MAG: hypothetical protein ACOC22_00330 [bacterium]